MTAQVTEVLHYKGEQLSMRTEPLSDYFAQMGHQPEFQAQSTACWRRYVGKWEILLDRLYLTGVSATYADGTAVTLDSLFPGFDERVFAHWYTGVISIPQGKVTQYVHMGYASRYERDLFLAVENGIVVDTQLRDNSHAISQGGSDE
jgi:hypothetical protein